jgi:hypothetical protein
MIIATPTIYEKYYREFFDELAEVLESEFPKGEKCECGRRLKARSHAIVLSAMANVFFRRILIEAGDEIIKRKT